MIVAAIRMQSNKLLKQYQKEPILQCVTEVFIYQETREHVVVTLSSLRNVILGGICQKSSFCCQDFGSKCNYKELILDHCYSYEKARSFLNGENFCTSNQNGTAYWNGDVLIIIPKFYTIFTILERRKKFNFEALENNLVLDFDFDFDFELDLDLDLDLDYSQHFLIERGEKTYITDRSFRLYLPLLIVKFFKYFKNLRTHTRTHTRTYIQICTQKPKINPKNNHEGILILLILGGGYRIKPRSSLT